MPSRPDYCIEIKCPFFNNGTCYQDRQISINTVGPGSTEKREKRRKELVDRSQNDPEKLRTDCQRVYEGYF